MVVKDTRRILGIPYGQTLLETSRNPTALQRSRASDFVWTPQDDALLKQLVEKYPNNWLLISEAFNSMRVSISIDRRLPADCFERWRNCFGNISEDDHRPPPQTPSTQMTTRGTKRSLSTNVASASAAGASNGAHSGEPKKRRRHTLMHEAIRKATKKREAAQKQNGNVPKTLSRLSLSLIRYHSCQSAETD